MVLISHLIASLWKQYIKHAKALQQTGGGIGQDSNNKGFADEGTNIVMYFYIPPTGLDNLTTPKARNLWGKVLCSLYHDMSHICIQNKLKQNLSSFLVYIGSF
jgi:hypothetical protein